MKVTTAGSAPPLPRCDLIKLVALIGAISAAMTAGLFYLALL
jgi:hypothetical protein